MAYNHGKEERKWRIWKEAEEKILRSCGVPECIIEQLRTYDRADFNSNRRFYTHSQETDTYLDMVAETESRIEVDTVSDLLNEIENENLYQALLTVDKRTLQIVLLKMQGYLFPKGDCPDCRIDNRCYLRKVRPPAEKAEAI